MIGEVIIELLELITILLNLLRYTLCITIRFGTDGAIKIFLAITFIIHRLYFLRFLFNKRSVGSTHSSHGNLSQASVNSSDVLSGDEVDSSLHRPAKISEQRSNSSTDIRGTYTVHVGFHYRCSSGLEAYKSNTDDLCIYILWVFADIWEEDI